MSQGQWRVLWALLAVGALARLVLGFATVGVPYDVGSFEIVTRALEDRDLLDVYRAVNIETDPGRYPYLPGLFPWLFAAGRLEVLTGLPYHGLLKLPAIAADLGIAWLVQHLLGRRGAAPSLRLAGAALVALGPLFLAVSAHHGQIDSIAAVAAVAGLTAWTAGGGRRALWGGLLLGLGAAVKTVPLLMVLALLPTSRSPREGVTLLAAAAAVPLAAVLPFAMADLEAVEPALGYGGAPGLGGLSLLIQPELARGWLLGAAVEPTALTTSVHDHGSALTIVALLAAGAFALRHRAPAPEATVLIWLTVYVFGTGFYLQYLVWGLPFFLLAGHVRKAALLQLALLLPIAVIYVEPLASEPLVAVYVVVMLAVWTSFAIALVVTGRRIAAAGQPAPLRLRRSLRGSAGG